MPEISFREKLVSRKLVAVNLPDPLLLFSFSALLLSMSKIAHYGQA
jgi:hypothetical protein